MQSSIRAFLYTTHLATQLRHLPSRGRRTAFIAAFVIVAIASHTSVADKPADSTVNGAEKISHASPAGTAKMSDGWSWSAPIVGPTPDANIGQWRAWVQQGWLAVERRTDDDKTEWKIVLAKVVGDEPPETDASKVDALRLTYRDGRYFVYDHPSGNATTSFGTLYCRRQRKTDGDPWPEMVLPPRDSDRFHSFHGWKDKWALSGRVTDSWVLGAAGEAKGFDVPSADCLVRLFQTDLQIREHGGQGGGGFARLQYGPWFLEDDGELLVSNRQEAWRLPEELERRAKDDPALASRLATRKLGGSPAPELSGDVWLNADNPPILKSLHGKPVMLVLIDLKQSSFLSLLPPLLEFHRTYREQGLAVIGVYAHAPRYQIAEHLTDEGIKFPVLIDDGKTAERYGVGYSACVLIDREGKVASVYKDSLAPPTEIEKLLPTKTDTAD
jgi:hypothetical protein